MVQPVYNNSYFFDQISSYVPPDGYEALSITLSVSYSNVFNKDAFSGEKSLSLGYNIINKIKTQVIKGVKTFGGGMGCVGPFQNGSCYEKLTQRIGSELLRFRWGPNFIHLLWLFIKVNIIIREFY